MITFYIMRVSYVKTPSPIKNISSENSKPLSEMRWKESLQNNSVFNQLSIIPSCKSEYSELTRDWTRFCVEPTSFPCWVYQFPSCWYTDVKRHPVWTVLGGVTIRNWVTMWFWFFLTQLMGQWWASVAFPANGVWNHRLDMTLDLEKDM